MNAKQRFPGWGSSQVAVLLQYAQSNGVAVGQVLKGSGLVEADLEKQDPSLTQELAVIENLVAAIPEHPFQLGLRVGLTCNANSFGLMGQALIACRTPKEMVDLVSEFFSGSFHFLKVRPRIQKTRIRTTFEVPSNLAKSSAQFLLGRDMGAAIAFQESSLVGLPSVTTAVGFIGPPLPGMAEVGEYYQCEVLFHQEQNYMDTHIRVMEWLLPMGNRFLSKVLASRLRNWFPAESEGPMSDPVLERRISELLAAEGYQDIGKEQVAAKLNVSARTLTRHLKREGTSWRALLTKLRIEKATQLLVESQTGMEAIAFELGYSSASAFSHAFSREMGKSPLEYRHENTQLQELEYW